MSAAAHSSAIFPPRRRGRGYSSWVNGYFTGAGYTTVALIAAALFGAAVPVTTMRAAIAVVRERRHDRRFLWGVPVTLAAAASY